MRSRVCSVLGFVFVLVLTTQARETDSLAQKRQETVVEFFRKFVADVGKEEYSTEDIRTATAYIGSIPSIFDDFRIEVWKNSRIMPPLRAATISDDSGWTVVYGIDNTETPTDMMTPVNMMLEREPGVAKSEADILSLAILMVHLAHPLYAPDVVLGSWPAVMFAGDSAYLATMGIALQTLYGFGDGIPDSILQRIRVPEIVKSGDQYNITLFYQRPGNQLPQVFTTFYRNGRFWSAAGGPIGDRMPRPAWED